MVNSICWPDPIESCHHRGCILTPCALSISGSLHLHEALQSQQARMGKHVLGLLLLLSSSTTKRTINQTLLVTVLPGRINSKRNALMNSATDCSPPLSLSGPLACSLVRWSVGRFARAHSRVSHAPSPGQLAPLETYAKWQLIQLGHSLLFTIHRPVANGNRILFQSSSHSTR